jgi:uncharacterized protein YbjQ (UPF0145 family)
MADDEAAAGRGHHAVVGTQFKTDKTDTKNGCSVTAGTAVRMRLIVLILFNNM